LYICNSCGSTISNKGIYIKPYNEREVEPSGFVGLFLFKLIMKQLEKYFIGKGQVKGFMFAQLKKTKYGYIYRVNDDGRIYYETFEHKENTRYNCVSLPSNKSFGVWAWTFKTLDGAINKLDEIDIMGEAREMAKEVFNA